MVTAIFLTAIFIYQIYIFPYLIGTFSGRKQKIDCHRFEAMTADL